MTDNTKNASFVRWIIDGFHHHNLGVHFFHYPNLGVDMGIDNSKSDELFKAELYKKILDFDPDSQPQINKLTKYFRFNIDNHKIVLTEYSKSFFHQYSNTSDTPRRRSNISFVKWVAKGIDYNYIDIETMDEPFELKFHL